MTKTFFIFTALLFFLCTWLGAAPKYVIVFIGDGFGQNQRELVETATGEKLKLNALPSRAPTTTFNALNETTDSAASGTAIACGQKTLNKCLGLDKDGKALKSIAVRLQERGFKIGIVTSSPLNDATPAAYYAHQKSRNFKRAITEEMAASNFDFFGGQPPSKDKKESSRDAERLTREILEKNDYHVFEGDDCLEHCKPGQKNAALRTPRHPGFNLPADSPSLADFTRSAIACLDNETGFFLMVEKGDIDYSGHQNDAAKLIHEVLDFDEAVMVGLAFQKQRPQDTLIIVTADHETGGLMLDNPTRETLTRLFAQKTPLTAMKKEISPLAKQGTPEARAQMLAFFEDSFFSCEAPFSDEEKARLEKVWDDYVAHKENLPGYESMYGKYAAPVIEAARIRDARCRIRYTTFGHSKAPVWTSAIGPGHEAFSLPMDNTQIPKKIWKIVMPNSAWAE